MPNPMPHTTLFIRLRLMGDIVFTIPALLLYKKKFPGSRVVYVVEDEFRQIGELLPGVDELVTVPRKMGIQGVWAFGREMRRRGVERVIDFHSGPKSACLTLSTLAPLRVGFRTPNRNLAYHVKVPRFLPGPPTHSVINQTRLLEAVDIGPEEIPGYPQLQIDEKKVQPAIRLFVSSDDPRVIIHTGAGNRFRDWGEKNFRHLVERLSEHGFRVGLVGNREEEVRRSVRLAEGTNVSDFSGRVSVAELLYLFAKSSVYVGADSGPLHLASLTSLPLVALYGPNVPEISGPWRRENVRILQSPLECRPCSQKRCLYDTMKCVSDITVEEVHEAILGFLFRS